MINLPVLLTCLYCYCTTLWYYVCQTLQKGRSACLVQCVIETILLMQMPVMIAVDDYNVLYSHANYHEWMNEVHRRQLQPHELRLVSALRILEQEVSPWC